MNKHASFSYNVPFRWLALPLFLLLVACENIYSPDDTLTLRFSVLPDQKQSILQQRYGPLLDYLEQETGIACKLIFSRDYSDLLNKFRRGDIDIARFGGVTFTMARARSQAEPLVMRDIDKKFRSAFLVRADNTATDLNEFKDKRFSFGSRLSTSGHLMPRYFLNKENIKPETFFKEVRYSGTHDRTANWVSQGVVDIGVANAEVIHKLLSTQQKQSMNIRILQETPPYADYVWAAQIELPESIKQKVIAAFLKLSNDTPQGKLILKAIGAEAYLPALNSEFEILENTVRQLGLLEKDNQLTSTP